MEEIRDCIKLRGSLRLVLGDLDGNLIKEMLIDNTVVTTGRAWMLGQLQSVNHSTPQNVSYIGIGSGTVAPVTGDSALGNEVTRLAISAFSTTGLTANPPSWRAEVVFATSNANTTLGEAALFNSSAAGTMIARATFASFVKATSNTFAISYTISG